MSPPTDMRVYAGLACFSNLAASGALLFFGHGAMALIVGWAAFVFAALSGLGLLLVWVVAKGWAA